MERHEEWSVRHSIGAVARCRIMHAQNELDELARELWHREAVVVDDAVVRENEQGRPTYIISQDLFADHVRKGLISTELLESRLLSFTFVADSQDVIISTPNKQELPGL